MEGRQRRLRIARQRTPSWPMVAGPELVSHCVGGVGVLLVGRVGRGGGGLRHGARPD